MKDSRYEGPNGLVVNGTTTMPDTNKAYVRDITEYVGLLLERAGILLACTATVIETEHGSPGAKRAACRNIVGNQLRYRLQPHGNDSCRHVRLSFPPGTSLTQLEKRLRNQNETYDELQTWKRELARAASKGQEMDESIRDAIFTVLQPDGAGLCIASSDPCGYASPEAIYGYLEVSDLPKEFLQGLTPAKVLKCCDLLHSRKELERSPGASPYFRLPDDKLPGDFSWAQRIGRQLYFVLTRCWPRLSYDRVVRLHAKHLADHVVGEAQINSGLAELCKTECGLIVRTGQPRDYFYQRAFGKVCIYENPARYENGEFHDLDLEFPVPGSEAVGKEPSTAVAPVVSLPVALPQPAPLTTSPPPGAANFVATAMEVIHRRLQSVSVIEALAARADEKRQQAFALNEQVTKRMSEAQTAGQSQRLQMISQNMTDLQRVAELSTAAQELEAELVEMYLRVDDASRKQLNGTCPDRIAAVRALTSTMKSELTTDRAEMDRLCMIATKYVVGEK